jgi:hypothetical protein
VVAVEGVAGVGKRALIEEFLAGVHVPVIRVNGIDVEPPVSWDVVASIIRQLPGVSADPAMSLDPQAVPSLVGQMLSRYLRQGTGTVLFLNDAQWADEQSMTALLYAALSLRDAPVLLVMAYQTTGDESFPAESATTPGLRRAWQQMLEGEHGLRLPLHGLPPDDILRLAAANGHPELSPGDARRLHESTGGNPDHVLQLLSNPSFHSILLDEGPLPVPRRLANAIGARLAYCSPPTRNLVSAAAVLGQQFSVAALRDVSGLENIRKYVEEAIHAGWLQDVPGSGGRELAFPGTVVRTVIYHDLNSDDRIMWHRRCAARGGPGAVLHRIAATDGVDDPLAADLRKAAADKMRARDVLGAAYYLQCALDVASPGPARTDLLLTTVELLLVAGKERATDEYIGALMQAPADPWRDYVLGYQRLLSDKPVEAIELLSGALAALDRGQPAPTGAPADLRARIATQLAVVGIVTLSYPDLIKYGALAVAEGSDEPWVRGFAWLAKTVGLALAGESAQAIALLDDAGEPGSESGLEGLAARA